MSTVSNRWSSLASMGLGALVALYVPIQSGYVVLTRLATGHGAGGLAILPYATFAYMALTFLFIWLSGWHRDVRRHSAGRLSLPVPTRETTLSGLGSAMMICAIPMSYSLASVSIPMMLVLVRGGILAAAPLIDLLHGRRIHWWSGTALVLVAAALVLVLHEHGVGELPPLAVVTVVLYNAGFLLRLVMMTRIAKRGDATQTRRYFVEEKLVALPLGNLVLLATVVVGTGGHTDSVAEILRINWSPGLVGAALGMGVALAATSLLTSLILLNARENTFCVPLERASSLLAGMVAAWLLHWGWNQTAPTTAEMRGAALLLAAILLLELARSTSDRRKRTATS